MAAARGKGVDDDAEVAGVEAGAGAIALAVDTVVEVVSMCDFRSCVMILDSTMSGWMCL